MGIFRKKKKPPDAKFKATLKERKKRMEKFTGGS